jgi:hypothetical protein
MSGQNPSEVSGRTSGVGEMGSHENHGASTSIYLRSLRSFRHVIRLSGVQFLCGASSSVQSDGDLAV